jgi:hypothetical protein
MFEFDEHFAELEAMQAALESSDLQDDVMLPNWAYLGNDVWKLDFEAAALEPAPAWLLHTADVT